MNHYIKTLLSIPLSTRLALLFAIIVLILPYSGILGSEYTDSYHIDEEYSVDEPLPLPDDFDSVLERGDVESEPEIVDELEDDGTDQ